MNFEDGEDDGTNKDDGGCDGGGCGGDDYSGWGGWLGETVGVVIMHKEMTYAGCISPAH